MCILDFGVSSFEDVKSTLHIVNLGVKAIFVQLIASFLALLAVWRQLLFQKVTLLNFLKHLATGFQLFDSL